MSYFTEKEKEQKIKLLLDVGFSNTQTVVILSMIDRVATELVSEIESLEKEIAINEKEIEAIENRLNRI